MRRNRSWVAIGLTVATLALLGIRVAVEARAGQGSSLLVGLILGGVVICVVVVAVFTTLTRQLSRIRTTGGRDVQAWRVIDPQRTLGSRFLLVSPANGWARLTDKHGHRLAEWTSDTFTRAEQKRLYPAGSLVAHLGLTLHAVDGSAVDILLPSPTTLTYPARYRADVTRALADAFGPSVSETA